MSKTSAEKTHDWTGGGLEGTATGIAAWELRGSELAISVRRTCWDIADWINEGIDEHNVSDVLDRAERLFGKERGTLETYASVGRAFPASIRIEELTFGHHRAVLETRVAGDDDATAERRQILLRHAVLEDLTVRQLKDIINSPAPEPVMAPEQAIALEQGHVPTTEGVIRSGANASPHGDAAASGVTKSADIMRKLPKGANRSAVAEADTTSVSAETMPSLSEWVWSQLVAFDTAGILSRNAAGIFAELSQVKRRDVTRVVMWLQGMIGARRKIKQANKPTSQAAKAGSIGGADQRQMVLPTMQNSASAMLEDDQEAQERGPEAA